MATFTIILRKANSEGWVVPCDRDQFTGAKMTRKWVKDVYGVNSTEYREGHEFYFVRKPNRFGVVWVTKRPNYPSYEICTSGKGEKIPFLTDYIVCKCA